MAARGGVQEGMVWHSAEVARFVGGVHENSVLFYFSRSPFFDQTSNNASVETQATYNASMNEILSTREAFEAHLRTMQGLEYVVASAPHDFGPEAPIGRGAWVINKQNRRKRPGADDEVNVLATYYVVGSSVCEAPTLGNVLLQKILSATFNLNSLFSTASETSTFTPALGHRYFQPTQQTQNASGSSQALQSKEPTPLPGAESQKRTETPNLASSMPQSTTAASTAADTQLLLESFDQFIRYNHEYMDENPLIGEPGAFVFSSSKLNMQHQAAQRAQQQKDMEEQRAKQNEAKPGRSVGEANESPLAEKPDAAAGKKNATSVQPQKPKRRKSKAPTTPTTPENLTSPTAA